MPIPSSILTMISCMPTLSPLRPILPTRHQHAYSLRKWLDATNCIKERLDQKREMRLTAHAGFIIPAADDQSTDCPRWQNIYFAVILLTVYFHYFSNIRECCQKKIGPKTMWSASGDRLKAVSAHQKHGTKARHVRIL